MKHKIWKNLISVFAAACTCLCLQSGVMADSGTVTVDFSVKNHTEGISGAEFSAVKILSYENGKYSVVTDKIITVNEVLKQPEQTAEKLAGQFSAEDGKRAVTGKDGITVFKNMDDGVWLVYQTGRTGDSEIYKLSSPALVQLPEWEDGILTDHVTIYPKTVLVKPGLRDDMLKETEPQNGNAGSGGGTGSSSGQGSSASGAKTGDSSHTAGWMVCMVLSAASIITARKMQRRRRDEE